MLQVRKLVLAVAAATAFTTGVAHALGLGNVSVKSSLNQPLEAEIELMELGGLGVVDIRTQLASSEAFSQAGLERQFFLTNLKFVPTLRADGKSVIRITSERAVREPYLNFLVEVLWPNGRVLREYTLLLDPPMYSPQEIVYTPAASETVERVQPAPSAPVTRSRTTAAAKPAPAAARRPAAEVKAGEQYRIVRNDTLWDIASRMHRQASIQQTMVAIYELNPDAFINGDINRIKSGRTLTLPDANQLQQRSRSSAAAEFAALTATPGIRATAPAQAQLDARQRTRAEAAPARVEQQDTLRLVAAETGETVTGADRGANDSETGNLREQLAQLKENLDSSQRENIDLQEQVAELSEQLGQLQQLIELKNTQLANLQNLEALETIQAQTVPAEADGEAVEAADAEESLVAQLGTEAAEEITAAESSLDVEAEVEEPVETESLATGQPVEAPSVAEETPAVTAQPEEQESVRPVPAPAPVAAQPSFFAGLMENPMLLPAAGGSAALLLLLLLLARRKKQAAEQDDGLASDPENNVALAGNELPVAAAGADAPETGLSITPEFVDAIAEADNYIAYGRFNQAADVLLQAIDENPQRADLHFKLLELYADTENKKGFERQLEELLEMGVSPAEIEIFKSRYAHLLGHEADIVSPDVDGEVTLDDLSLDMPFETEEILTGQDETLSFDSDEAEQETADDALLDLDELSLELDAALESSSLDAMSVDEFDLSELDDLDLELRTAGEESARGLGESTAEPDMAGALDGLVLELEEPADLTSEKPAAADEVLLSEPEMSEELGHPVETEDLSVELDDLPAELASLESEDLTFEFNSEPAGDKGETQDFADTLGAQELDSMLDSAAAADDGLNELADNLLADEPVSPAFEASASETDALELTDDELSDFDFGELEASLNATMQPDVEHAGQPVQAAVDAEFAPLDLEEAMEDDFSFLAGTDEITTKLDLAQAYIDMGDSEGARDILDEVISEGTQEQQQQARELKGRIS